MHGLSRSPPLVAVFYASVVMVLMAATATTISTDTTTDSAHKKNLDIEYAILTITSDHALFRIESVINATNGSSVSPLQLMTKFTPTKIDVQLKIASGEADPLWADTEIEHVKAVLEDVRPGFKAALDEHEKRNPFSPYRPNNRTPEAIWDFTYATSAIAAKNVKDDVSLAKSDEIPAKLEKLNNEMEEMFRSSIPLNVTEMERKIDAFTAESAKIYRNFALSVVVVGRSRVDEYRRALAREKEKLAADAAMTQAPTVPAATVAVTLPPTGSGATTSAHFATKTTVAMSLASVVVFYCR